MADRKTPAEFLEEFGVQQGRTEWERKNQSLQVKEVLNVMALYAEHVLNSQTTATTGSGGGSDRPAHQFKPNPPADTKK